MPQTIDWRVHGAVTAVKNQGDTNYDWIFAAVGAMECTNFIKTGTLKSLSEQQIVDCLKLTKCIYCHGYHDHKIENAFKYAINKGIENESSYPYTSRVGTCKYNSSQANTHFTSFNKISKIPCFETNLINALFVSPLVISIEVYSDFDSYKAGVYTPNKCAYKLCKNYYLLLVGVNEDYYICKNSMGTSWGIEGYIYIKRCPNIICDAWTINA